MFPARARNDVEDNYAQPLIDTLANPPIPGSSEGSPSRAESTTLGRARTLGAGCRFRDRGDDDDRPLAELEHPFDLAAEEGATRARAGRFGP